MSNSEPASQITHKSLPRVLGLFDATALVVGSIIGSGIFLKVGKVDQALMAWGFLPIIGVWIFVGLVTLCGSLALAELAAMYPHAGGPYLYLREAYGRLPAFLWGWTEFWVVRTGSLGALACASVIYLDEFLRPPHATAPPLGHMGQFIMALSIVVGLTVINIISTRWGAAVQNVATVVKVGFLTLLIVLPLLMGKMNIDHLSPLWVASPEPTVSAVDVVPNSSESHPQRSLLAALGLALIAVFWPYDGWINIAPVAEEIHEPQHNVPKALAIGIAVVVLVYVGANMSYHLVLSMPEVAKSSTLASDIFRVLFGEWGSKFAALGVCCSTFGSALHPKGPSKFSHSCEFHPDSRNLDIDSDHRVLFLQSDSQRRLRSHYRCRHLCRTDFLQPGRRCRLRTASAQAGSRTSLQDMGLSIHSRLVDRDLCHRTHRNIDRTMGQAGLGTCTDRGRNGLLPVRVKIESRDRKFNCSFELVEVR